MNYTGMYAAVKTIATIISLVFFIDRLGRRKLLITSSIGTCLPLWYIGAFVTAQNIDLKVEQEKSVAGWVAIVCVYVYAVSLLRLPVYLNPHFFPCSITYHCSQASFSVAWNGVVWVYCAEIFPTRIKELAVCLTTAVQWICQVSLHHSPLPHFSLMPRFHTVHSCPLFTEYADQTPWWILLLLRIMHHDHGSVRLLPCSRDEGSDIGGYG